MTRKTYRVRAEHDGSWWILHVPEIRSATQVRRLDRAEAMVRDLIYAITDEPTDSFDVDIRPSLPKDLAGLVARASSSSSKARVQQLEASISLREAAAALEAAGLTRRDTGRLLGVSYQRVQQLLADDTDMESHTCSAGLSPRRFRPY